MKKQDTKIVQIATKPTEIYHRLMRYPVFPRKPKRKIIHKVNEKGSVIAITNDATVEDFEKLLCLVYLIQTGKAKEIKSRITTENGDEVTIIETSLYQLKKVSRVHDYVYLYESFLRLSNVTIFYDFVNSQSKHEKIILKPLFKVVLNENNTLKAYFFAKFLELCKKKALKLDLEVFLGLPQIAKNLYIYIYSNLDKTKFSIDKLTERTLIKYDSTNKYALRDLRSALSALKKQKIIHDFTIYKKKRKVVIQYSKRQKKQIQ